MAVSLIISESFQGAAYADSLTGGGTGIDMGSVTNNAFAPLVDKTLNQGAQEIYIAHDGVEEITDVKLFISNYDDTGFTYGGAVSAAADIAQVITYGQASGSSKNNGDGLSSGVWMDMRFNSNDTTRFDQATFPSDVKIFGDNGTDGISLSSAYVLGTGAMVKDAPGEAAADTPIAGVIGPVGDATLGEAGHLQTRIYWPNAATIGGVFQIALNTAYAFTA